MRIGCLGWGSLIWKPGELRLADDWRTDGPALPIEFSRVSDGGELATAICLGAGTVNVLWAPLIATSLQQPYESLANREGIPEHRTDGVGVLVVNSDDEDDGLNHWARAQRLDALIWTALPPRYQNTENRIPTAPEAVDYLRSLDDAVHSHAREYVEKVPVQISTAYRQVFTERLGW